jgi:hypothetical protein
MTSPPPPAPRSARQAFGQSYGAGRLIGFGTGQSQSQGQGQGQNKPSGPRGRMPIKLVVGVLATILLVSSAIHIVPAVRAGLHDGTRGTWVVTSKTCRRAACIWNGKFVAPGGHVLVSSAKYAGQMPTGIHVGTTVPALFTGGSGLVFPVTGSDLWIELLIALLGSALALYWASHRWVAKYLRERRDNPQIPSI